jgi:hypothetical protein
VPDKITEQIVRQRQAEGKVALEAAFHPARTNYLYFVLRDPEAGTHQFSRDLDEHNKAKKLYPPDLTLIQFWNIPWPNKGGLPDLSVGRGAPGRALGKRLLGFHVQYHCNTSSTPWTVPLRQGLTGKDMK